MLYYHLSHLFYNKYYLSSGILKYFLNDIEKIRIKSFFILFSCHLGKNITTFLTQNCDSYKKEKMDLQWFLFWQSNRRKHGREALLHVLTTKEESQPSRAANLNLPKIFEFYRVELLAKIQRWEIRPRRTYF